MKKFNLTFLVAILVLAATYLGFAPTATTYAATDYHAFMGIQTNTKLWIFRNSYDDKNYGYDTDAFTELHSVSGKNILSYDGTFTDANLPKDGTYTVTLDHPDFSTEKNLSQLYVSTDIPMSKSVKVTDVIVKMDGTTLYTFDKAAINPESLTYIQIMCLNIWNPDVKALFSSDLPFSKCEITFTISGLEAAAAEQEALKDFTFKMYKDHAAITGYTGSDTTVTIPSMAYAKDVTEISANAFQNLSIKKVIIPDTVTTIGKYAFYNTKLISVTIPKSVTSIKEGAFASSPSCQKITVTKGNPNYVVKDGVLFSKDMKTLVLYPAGKTGTSYTIPNSVITIQGSAFDGCTKLTKLTISSKVKTIGKDAFKGCKKLTLYAPSGSVAYTYAVKLGMKAKKS